MRRRKPAHILPTVAAAALVGLLAACSNGASSAPDPAAAGDAPDAAAAAPVATVQVDAAAAAQKNLDDRKVDYSEALRSASLKLTGDLPTLAEIKNVEANGKTAYEKTIDTYLADKRFGERMIRFWRDTFKTGGAGKSDSAAIFAAMVVVQDRPYTDLFTAPSGTCPTYDGTTGTFAAADCTQNMPAVGVINDAGLMSQYYGNLAFRRVRFVQETFACSKFPSEFSSTPQAMGAGAYTSPWDFDSIAGGKSARVDFQDTSSVVCANCHTTINHRAPLFADFDDQGVFTPGVIQVKTPVPGNPTSVLEDWLPTGKQHFYWKDGGAEVKDLPGLGQEIAKDPVVASCAINRVWDWAMSRGDIVNDSATIPDLVTKDITTDFQANGFKLKRAIRNVFTSDDYVKF